MPPAGATIPCLQQVGSGGAPLAVTAAVSGLSPATTYTVTLLATSAQGSASGSPVTFPTPSTGAGAGTTLSVTNLTLSPTRFRRGTHTATLAKHAGKHVPAGTTISFTLSQAATVKLAFQRAQPGTSSAGRCQAPSPKRHGRRCTRYAAVPGSVSVAAPAGSDRVSFDGVLTGATKLTPGSYRLVVAASEANGTATAAQQPVFTLLK